MNMWGFTPSVFDELEALSPRFLREAGNLEEAEFFLPEVVNDLPKAKKTRVRVLPTPERWVGMTYRANEPAVEQYISPAEAARLGHRRGLPARPREGRRSEPAVSGL